MQKRLMVVGVINEQKHSITIMFLLLTLSGNFYSLEIWHEIFLGLNFGLGIFFGFCLKP